MGFKERKISDYIDKLNAEQKPEEHERPTHSPELDKLMDTIKLVRTLKEPALPEAGYPKRLAQAIGEQLSSRRAGKNKARLWLTSIAGIAAILVLAIVVNLIPSLGTTGIIHAMEEAYQQVKAYHGYIEIIQTNEEGESTIQGKLEVWANKEGHYYTKVLEGLQNGLVTVNNGQKKWQVRPNQNEIHVFPAFPDAYRFTFELGKEIDQIVNALSTKVVGQETVAGRETSILEVSPDGGMPYRIWIDKETKLPLKKQSTMHNALQYTVTYTEVDFADNLPNELVTYNVPNGFKEIDTNPEQLVDTMDQVENILGFVPQLSHDMPNGYTQHGIAVLPNMELVKIYYTANENEKMAVFMQGSAKAELEPANTAILGKVGNNIAEIQSPIYEGSGILGGGVPYAGTTDMASIRWQLEGFEYAVVGNIGLEELISFTQDLTNKSIDIPSTDEQSSANPQREVEIDFEVEKNQQKSVDAGQSPWKLDPVYVAQVYVSLQISPEGITGEYPISTEDLSIVINDGKNAIVEISGQETPIKRVYLKRLIRQDSTGIWTVVGYDPVVDE
jgi:outer membrane lipoprotein-sorting protein